MAEWRDFDASNKPDTCLWCGKKLRHKSQDEVYETTDVPLSPDDPLYDVATTKRVTRMVSNTHAEKGGDYQDGCFCGLRCGYMFGVRLAELGRRLTPMSDRPEGENNG